jgi:hypothetical protein
MTEQLMMKVSFTRAKMFVGDTPTRKQLLLIHFKRFQFERILPKPSIPQTMKQTIMINRKV